MRAELAAFARDRLGSLRPVGEEGLHVTVAFLGWIPDGDAGGVWETARGAVPPGPAPLFVPGGLVGVPRRRARLVALDLSDDGGRAAQLAEPVGAAPAREGLYEPEDRPFWPHVTLARASRGARVELPHAGPSLGSFSPPSLALMRSDLSPKGARYTALERLLFKGSCGAHPSPPR